MAVAKERLAAQTKKAIKVSNDDLVYFEYLPGDSDKTPIVLAGGLYYELRNFEQYKTSLAMQGFPIVIVARRTQPESLAQYKGKHKPAFLDSLKRPTLETFADDHKAVIDHLGFKKVNIMTLSYGSSVGTALALKYPDIYNEITLVAPLMYTGDMTPAEFKQQMQIESFLKLNPFTSKFTISALHEVMAEKNGHRIIDNMVRPDSIANQVSKEWLYAGVQADTRAVENGRFDLRQIDLSKLKNEKILIAGLENPYLLKIQMDYFLEQIKNNPELKVIFFEGAAHAINAAAPIHLSSLQAALEKFKLGNEGLYYINTLTSEFNFAVINEGLQKALKKAIDQGKISELNPTVLAPILTSKAFQKSMELLVQNISDLSEGLNSKGPFSDQPLSMNDVNPERPYENIKNYKMNEEEKKMAGQLLEQMKSKLNSMQEKLEEALNVFKEIKGQ